MVTNIIAPKPYKKTAFRQARAKNWSASQPARLVFHNYDPRKLLGYFCHTVRRSANYMPMNIEQKRDFAKLLYVRERLTQKEVAKRVDAGEHAVGRWVKDGGWDKIRRSLLVTKHEQIAMLYGQLEAQNTVINEREVKVANNKEADVISKLCAAIRSLETEVNIGDRIEIGMEFGEYIRQNAPEKVGDMVELFDSYIKTKIK